MIVILHTIKQLPINDVTIKITLLKYYKTKNPQTNEKIIEIII